MAIISSFIMAISSHSILMAGWVSNTTVALYIIPFFFLGLWFYKNGKSWGLILTIFLLGLLIQSQILMVYNIVTLFVLWWVFKLKRPKIKTILLSLFYFIIATSTIILAGIKSNFSEIRIFIHPQRYLPELSIPFTKRLSLFIEQFIMNFSFNLTPNNQLVGIVFWIGIFLILIVSFFNREGKTVEKNRLILLILFLTSPIFMLIIGYHNTPWTLIGMIPAVFIVFGYAISKINSRVLKITILTLISLLNICSVIKN